MCLRSFDEQCMRLRKILTGAVASKTSLIFIIRNYCYCTVAWMVDKQFSDLQNHAKSNTGNRKRGSGTQVCACPFISPFSLQAYTSPHPLVLVCSYIVCHPNLTPIGSLSKIVICCWIYCLVPGCGCNWPQHDSDPVAEVIKIIICIGTTDLFTNCY